MLLERSRATLHKILGNSLRLCLVSHTQRRGQPAVLELILGIKYSLTSSIRSI
jgi:hypothetical protein